MTTIDLPAEVESYLQQFRGSNPRDYGTYHGYLLSLIANALPEPPYVPEVGDVVRIYDADLGREHSGEFRPENVIAVTDTHVISRWHTDTDETLRPEVYAYRIDAHRFEKVEQ